MSDNSKKIELSDRFTGRVSSAVMAAAALGLAATTLAGCAEPDTNAHAYKTVAQCVNDGVYTRSACEQMDGQARSLHARSAPRYESKKDCEQDFGREQCEAAPARTSGGHSSFVYLPHYGGYYGGYSGSYGSSAAANGNGGASRSLSASPLYRTVDGVTSTAQGDSVPAKAFSRAGAPTYAASLKASTSPISVAKGTSVVKSGGFGSTARGMSVGG